MPFTNDEYSLSNNHKIVPISASGFPNSPSGVWLNIFSERAVRLPSSFNNKSLFCYVKKNPGAIALTLISSSAK